MKEMKKFYLNRWFSLPTLGKDIFRELMQCGVKYDKKFGFRISSETNLTRFTSAISDALGEEIEIARSCYICDDPIESEKATLCENCIDSSNSFSLYVAKFEAQMEGL